MPKKQTFVTLSLLIITMLLSIPAMAGSDTGKDPAGDNPAAATQDAVWLPFLQKGIEESWNMAGGNPQRTSWVPRGVDPRSYENFGVIWYRPLEAYIGQHIQIVAARNKLYVSTANGVYALDVATGDVVWRFDTELPLGHSPTVVDDRLFVGGLDRRVYALDADTGALAWKFEQAKAGFSTNPLVIDGSVFIGGRDGYFYALDKASGALRWRYPAPGQPPIGPIFYSPAIQNGQLFFAANDNFAYSLDSATGLLKWRSGKLPGDGFQAWWPVIYKDYVVFSTALPYAADSNPGTFSFQEVIDPSDPYYSLMKNFQYGFDTTLVTQRDDIFHKGEANNSLLGPTFLSGTANDSTGLDWSWANGSAVIDASKMLEYLESDGQQKINRPTNKPWRRTLVVLSLTNGLEYGFDTDRDGRSSYAPFAFTGTKSGNTTPPLVIPTIGQDGIFDDVLYASNFYQYRSGWDISRARLHAWQFGTQYVHPVGADFAIDEPFTNTSGGSMVYQNLCCDRVGATFNLETNTTTMLWDYSHTLESIKMPWEQIESWRTTVAPGYDLFWWGASMFSNYPRLFGSFGSENGIYHNHGLQSPIIPYKDFLIVHRSNAIIVFGPNPVELRRQKQSESPQQYEQNIRSEYPQVSRSVLDINPPDLNLPSTFTLADAQKELDSQIKKILDTGHLRPGYYNSTRGLSEFANYFENPGETLYTLTLAYPHVSNALKPDLAAYINQEYHRYFETLMSARTGYWIDSPKAYSLAQPDGFGQLQPREWMPLPPEINADLPNHQRDFWAACCWPWGYPQHNFYSMWLYADTFFSNNPTKLSEIYALAKSRLETTPPDISVLQDKPWVHNAYITGYLGFLKLQDLAGKSGTDAALRSTVSAALAQLVDLRTDHFTKDTPWPIDQARRGFNIAANFLYLVPESAALMRQNLLPEISEAVEEYETVAPYWFVSRYEAAYGEFASHHLYTGHALFLAKAYILQEPTGTLLKYVDVPGFAVGDLFYIQNLVAVLDSSK